MLAWIESSALATWTRESTSIWAYPTILTLHTFGLGIVVGASAVIDFRLLGYAIDIPLSSLRPLFRIIFWAFVLNFLTGVVLFMADATHKAGQWVFYVKLGLIALALVNMAAVKKMVFGSAAVPPEGFVDRAALSPGASASARRLAIISLVLWTGAIIAGRLMAYL